MYTASFVDSQIKGMKAEGLDRADIIWYLTGYCQGWGYVFGAAGEGFIRMSFANSYENIVEGLKRMREAMGKILG